MLFKMILLISAQKSPLVLFPVPRIELFRVPDDSNFDKFLSFGNQENTPTPYA